MTLWILLLTWILSFIGYIFKAYDFTVLFSFAAYLIFCYAIIRYTGINSITFVYLALFGLYGFSVPLSISLGADIGTYRQRDIQNWFNISDSLYSFVLINHLALLGMIIAYIIHYRDKPLSGYRKPDQFSTRDIRNLSYIIAVVSGIFEIINFIRTGGFNTISQGKLIYQSALSDLSPTLPSELFCYLSFILWAVSLKDFRISHILSILLVNSIFLAFNLYIGERGTLMTIFIILFLGFTYHITISKVKPLHVMALLIIYMVVASLAVYRNVFALGLGNSISYSLVSDYLKQNSKTLLFVLNPANSEFGTSCLNYRVYYEQDPLKKPLFGKTYLHFYSQLLPERINPFYDPAVTVQFRDRFFPERAEEGATGGTAYSSLLESYMNFREIGGLLLYMVFFYLLLKMEVIRYKTGNYFVRSFYLILSLMVLLFHRSSFEYVIYTLLYMCVYLGIVLLLYDNLKIWLTWENKKLKPAN